MNKQSHRNSYGQMFKSGLMIFLTLFLSAFFIKSYALVFNIVPSGTLPTTVNAGGSVLASYLIQNNTLSQRNNNFIKYLPPHVSIAPGGCGSTFNLAPHGQPGDSCILNLSVSGSVNPNDPDPHHHLFACFPGGITCAGTNFPLNVILIPTPPPPPHLVSISITPVNATITPGSTQQYIAIGHFSNGATQDFTSRVLWNSSNPAVATIDANGLALGVTVGTTNITASKGPFTSNTAHLTVTDIILWAIHGTNVITFCPVNPNGTLGICTNTGGTGFNQPVAMALNIGHTIGYVANSGSDTISICPINPNGTFGACSLFSDPLFSGVNGIALNPTNTFAYISNATSNTVVFCPVLVGGGLGACSDTGGTGFSAPNDTQINSAGTQAYILNIGTGRISTCPINVGGTFGVCTNTAAPLGNGGLTINTANTFAYTTLFTVPSGNGGVSFCEIDGSGNLFSCVLLGAFPIGTLSFPLGLVTNGADTFAYIANFGDDSIYRCPINAATGTFTSCINTAPSGAVDVLSLAITK